MAAADNGEIWFIDNPYPYGGVNSFVSVLRRANRNGSVTSYGAAFSKLTPDYSSSNCASIDAASAPLPLATSVFCAGPKNVVTTTNGDVYVASAGSGPSAPASLRRFPHDGGPEQWLFANSGSGTCNAVVGGTTLASPPAFEANFSRLTSDGTSVFWSDNFNGGRLMRYDPLSHSANAWPPPSTCACGFSMSFAIGVIAPNGTVFEVAYDRAIQAFTPAALSVDSCSPPFAQAQPTPLAGATGFGPGPTYVDGPGADARFDFHVIHHDRTNLLLALGSSGAPEMYVADTGNFAIRKIAPLDDTAIVSTVVGGPPKKGSADGVAGAASFNHPSALAVAFDGTVYVADSGNGRMRRIDDTGTVTTLFGDGTPTVRDGGPLLAALDNVSSMLVLPNHAVWFADGSMIRSYDPASSQVTTVVGRTAAGDTDGVGGGGRLAGPLAMALLGDGTVAVADAGNNAIRLVIRSLNLVTLAGGAAGAENLGYASTFKAPQGIAATAAGTLLVSDTGNQQIRSLKSDGSGLVVTTVAGAPSLCGDIVDGPCASARFRMLGAMTVRANGDLLVLDTSDPQCGAAAIPPPATVQVNHSAVLRRVRDVESPSTCTVSTIAGDRGPRSNGVLPGALPAAFNQPAGLVAGPGQTLWLCDTLENAVLSLDLGD